MAASLLGKAIVTGAAAGEFSKTVLQLGAKDNARDPCPGCGYGLPQERDQP